GLAGGSVDREGEHAVLKRRTLGMDMRKDLNVEALKSGMDFQPMKRHGLGAHATTIIERNDAPVRRAEGMELHSGVLLGELPGEMEIEVAGLRLVIDPLHSQKTGLYLDQLAHYEAVASYSRGRRVLDWFTNQGAFALACARA